MATPPHCIGEEDHCKEEEDTVEAEDDVELRRRHHQTVQVWLSWGKGTKISLFHALAIVLSRVFSHISHCSITYETTTVVSCLYTAFCRTDWNLVPLMSL